MFFSKIDMGLIFVAHNVVQERKIVSHWLVCFNHELKLILFFWFLFGLQEYFYPKYIGKSYQIFIAPKSTYTAEN